MLSVAVAPKACVWFKPTEAAAGARVTLATVEVVVDVEDELLPPQASAKLIASNPQKRRACFPMFRKENMCRQL